MNSDQSEENSKSREEQHQPKLEKVRDILFAQEKERLSAIEGRLDDPEKRAREVGEVFAASLKTRRTDDEEVGTALSPFIENSLAEAVRKDPAGMAQAIFPVLGPAIRKAIRSALREMFQSLNQTLDKAFSLRGLRWRLEAWRTGVSFGEVALLHTLVYRVEQVFLIHKETGLLLAHVSDETITFQDPDQVSAMFSAIRDFVNDSFGSAGEGVESLQVGDLNVAVEEGPHAAIAAVVRGAPPAELRECLRRSLETIHATSGSTLRNFDGDAEPFEKDIPALEDCLIRRHQQPTRKMSPAFSLLLVAVAFIFVFTGYIWFNNGVRCRGFIQRLADEPGVSVLEWQRKGMSGLYVRGLLDPLAGVPQQWIAESELDSDLVEMQWEPFFSTEPEIIIERAKNVLQPPASVLLTLNGDVLTARGSASGEWIRDAGIAARLIPGVLEADMSHVLDLSSIKTLQNLSLLFPLDSLRLLPGQEANLDVIAESLEDLNDYAAASGKTISIFLIGFTDDVGTRRHNLKLSEERALKVMKILEAKRFPDLEFLVTGAGPQEMSGQYREEETKSLFRCVRFGVEVENVE